MTLLRAAYRTMLASYFVASGVKALRDPDSLVPHAEPLTDRVVPLVKEYAPQQVAGYIPEDAKTLVRVNGATQVVGGLALASGKGRRMGALLLAGSLVPSTIAKHPFWSRSDPEQRAEDQHQFLKNVSLLGGVLLASRDTEGKPSIAWRAQKGGQAIAKSTSKASDKLAKKAEALTDSGSDFADTALATGAALVGTVVATSQEGPQGGHQAVRQGAGGGRRAGRGGAEGRAEGRQAGQEGRAQAAQGGQEGCRRAGRGGQKLAAERPARAPRPRPRRRRKQGKKLAKNIGLGKN